WVRYGVLLMSCEPATGCLRIWMDPSPTIASPAASLPRDSERRNRSSRSPPRMAESTPRTDALTTPKIPHIRAHTPPPSEDTATLPAERAHVLAGGISEVRPALALGHPQRLSPLEPLDHLHQEIARELEGAAVQPEERIAGSDLEAALQEDRP